MLYTHTAQTTCHPFILVRGKKKARGIKHAYLKTREHLELNLNENVHVTLINSDRPIFDPTAGVARIRFCSEHLF
jgi:hypothetical protein